MEFGEEERYACAALFTLALHMSQVPFFPFADSFRSRDTTVSSGSDIARKLTDFRWMPLVKIS